MEHRGPRIFDADNHYYEALDAFTRHLDPKLGPRVIQWAEIDGHKHHVIGGRIDHSVVNPTFDPVAKAGALYSYFRGNPEGKTPADYMREREPIPPEYRDRDARLRWMDQQGIAQLWLFPTLGMIYEVQLRHDPEAVTWMFRAFNQWLDEDWGMAFRERIFAAPYISLVDVDWAVRELEWALGRGARIFVLLPQAAYTSSGVLSPFDPHFDPFWSRVNEAGISAVVHAGNSGYTSNGYAEKGPSQPGFARKQKMPPPSVAAFSIERAAHDYLASAVFQRLFERFPNLRMASVENGSEFLPDLVVKLGHSRDKHPGWYRDDPVETLRRFIWMNPFWEDDIHEVVRLMGADRVIFGSDWPHIEGLPRPPLDYLPEVQKFEESERSLILGDNARELTRLRPA